MRRLEAGQWTTLLTHFTGAIALAEYIAESAQLVRLDLRSNGIKTAGLMALTLSLKVSQTVTSVDLDQDVKKDSVSLALVSNHFLFCSGLAMHQ